jgi:hypothetical protein
VESNAPLFVIVIPLLAGALQEKDISRIIIPVIPQIQNLCIVVMSVKV